MNTSETIQRQIDELSALKAIFGTDLRDLRKNSDNEKNWSPIEVEITLKPMVSMSELNKESFVQLDLYVKCGQKYPNVIPDDISFRNVKGLSSIASQQLRSELYSLAKQLRGEVMIFQFTDHCRQYLHQHNKPPLKSFYDEMLSQKTKLEIQKNLELEKKMQIIRIRDEQKHKLLEEELQRKQIASKVESKLRRESCDGNDLIHLTTNSSNDNKYYIKSSLTKCNSSHGTNCIVFSVNGVERKVQKGKCLFHNHLRQSIEYLGIDLLSGEPVVIVEWILNINQIKQNPLLEFELTDEKSVDDIVKRISKIENFFKTKIKSLDNSNLIRYLSFKYSIESEYIVVDLLQEHINGNSLFSLANVLRGQPLDVNLIRHYSKQILEALSYLHKQHCPHGDIRETNVYIDGMTGNIKISGYYLEKQFFDLYCDLNFDDSKPLNSNIFSTNIHRLMKRDIYQFGLLITAISTDWNFINDSNIMHFNSQFKRYNFDNELKNFLEKCIDSDENARWSSEILLNHSFLSQKTSFASNTDKKDDDSRQLSISNRKQEQPESGKNFEKSDSRVLLNSLVPSGVLHSRLNNEFEVIDELGKGGFGYVYKVKNLLDGRCYALKKISINPSNPSLHQKIKREVNLLSRLDHENVVRYFCSWIETEANASQSDEEMSSSGKASDNLTQISLKKENNTKKASDENSYNLSFSELSIDEAEEDIFGTSFLVQIPHKLTNSSDDQYVIFEGSNYMSTDESTIDSNKKTTQESVVKIPRQYMYIQMELCEKSTLRDAIDSGLYNDMHRKRRLFREIVEGLVHIHQQGMIHRDLKPGNIFLDGNDHVKIGDFGLAKEIYIIKEETVTSSSIQTETNVTQESDKFRLTGRIGTPFYVAPELTNVNAEKNSNKIFYTQRVDIYSLGIIFFEMSYPFQTLMERTKVVIDLRKPEINLPNDVNQHFTDLEIELLKSLLQHDYSLRPSSSELLASDYLPAPEMEVKEEQNVIRRAVQNPRTKIHKYMLKQLFEKEISEIEDYVYDINEEQFQTKKSLLLNVSTKQRIFQYVYSTLEAIMLSHCAISLSLPTLIPKYSTRKYGGNDVFYVIDRNGFIVSLPHDLRVPFARYVARNQIYSLRRYSIEKVYRQKRVLAYHPRELWECAFDIVTPKSPNSSHIMPDIEVLSVLCHVVQKFPMLQGFKLTLKVNHIKLVKAIFNYCDIPEEQHENTIKMIAECNSIKLTQNILKDSNDSLSNNSNLALKIVSQVKKLLEKFIDETRINLLLQLIDLEQDSVKKLLSSIKTHMRKKGTKQQNALENAKKALKELELILLNAERLGNFNKFSVKISPGFVLRGSSFNIYSGMIFQLEREIKQKKEREIEDEKQTQRQRSTVIAVGGRYDDLLTHFDVVGKKNDKLIEPKGAVGISIEFEKIMNCVLDEENRTKNIFGDVIDVVVCSLTTQSSDAILKEFCSITKEFWNSGVKGFCFPEDLPKNIDELHTFCLKNSVRYAIVLKDNLDSTQSNFHQIIAKLFAYEKERSIDKKVGIVSDVVEYVIRSLSLSKNEINNVSINGNENQGVIVRSDSNKFISSQSIHSNDANYSNSSAVASNIKVTFISMERLTSAPKRRHENSIISHLSSSLNFVMNNTIIEVLAVDLPFKVIKTIAGEVEFEGENGAKNAFEKSKLSVMDKHPRYRKYIAEVMDVVYTLKVDKKCLILTIISYTDNMKFKILS